MKDETRMALEAFAGRYSPTNETSIFSNQAPKEITDLVAQIDTLLSADEPDFPTLKNNIDVACLKAFIDEGPKAGGGLRTISDALDPISKAVNQELKDCGDSPSASP